MNRSIAIYGFISRVEIAASGRFTGFSACGILRKSPGGGGFMLLEFYRDGAGAPLIYDVFIHSSGALSYPEPTKPSKTKMRVVIELQGERANTYQANAIYHIISKHQHCAVSFHGFGH